MYASAQRNSGATMIIGATISAIHQTGAANMITTRTLVFAGVFAALSPGISLAQDAKNQGYLVDTYGNNIVTSSTTGLCWRDSDWTPARSVEPCDPVARKAEAPPQPAPAPEKMVPQKIEFSADALFDFDKSVLKPEGKEMLDDLARELNGANYEVIVATGHADRIGSNAYNQKLSERRANAVKDYLAGRGIPAERINASGKGETQPKTKPGDCKGPVGKKLIACLQPDRRVDVEVTGTKAPATGSR
jgi:OOP family OmpA-OmpF porin